ncbi:MAG TPA: HU family DNA-binding protein [Candidatus Krumholzibacteria bacterium]|nr:HU family DNA-binding protein [Candidatus Krumholzibacteria bacterium]
MLRSEGFRRGRGSSTDRATLRGERSMTKADLVETIALSTGLSKKDTNVVVNGILENISKALSEGDKVELRGFGSFKVKQRRSRRARNPRTGSAVDVPSKLVPYFKASNELKDKVNSDSASIPA